MTDLDTFIARLPKAELHLHIEGSLEPELMFELARRNQVEIPYASVEEVRAAYAFTRLQDFLDIYYAGANVLRTRRDFHDMAMAYFDRAARDGVVHAELMFDPQTHTDRGIPFAEVIEGLLSAMEEARTKHGMTSCLILSFLRHLSEEAAFETLAAAEPWLDRIAAVGLDSSEVGHPPIKFAQVFAAAREKGLKLTAHAGEEGPPEYVYQALDLIDVDRIDHGNRALEDPVLTRRLADSGMTLTVCPLSNLKLCVIDDIVQHPIDAMLKAGLKATLNSDDPAYFGGYIADNYRAVAEARGLGREDLVTLARNSFTGSFLPEEDIARHLAAIDAFVAEVA
ncbi:adenosine deaminase [Novosphingobium decolorationis]|uniref:Adenine deaminase n=1 Tax=Novosphingobium decolorationis TaxID=2698673 RepID=A0ABX8EAB7_9SPHN|nr:adenosine deaminase [Novosphingobium decolorationis]MED5544573.1 adenosine deaminase [Pseudomonadota bacterium]QVM86147.1 adenosine deaminase [Novosphingobium decolorationis]